MLAISIGSLNCGLMQVTCSWLCTRAHQMQERNLYYVVQVEVFLSKVFNSDAADTEDESLAFEGAVPPHFYGEMAKTELGCQILQEKGHFAEFTQFISKHGLEGDDAEIIMKLKSILWAVVRQCS